MTIFITDKKENAELELVPEFTNNTWTTQDEIYQWNNGEREDAGFHYNEELDRWETTSENFQWWKELADGRQKARDFFDEPQFCDGTEERDGYYCIFASWFRENTNELEDEKKMYERIPDFIEAIRNGEMGRHGPLHIPPIKGEEALDSSVADEIEDRWEKEQKK